MSTRVGRILVKAGAAPFCLSLERQGFGKAFPNMSKLSFFLKASLTSGSHVTIHGIEDQSMQPESPQVGLNSVGKGKFIRKEDVEGCQTLGWVGAADQKTGGELGPES